METKIRYLEMLQNIISRMAKNSFLLKIFTFTLFVVLIMLLGTFYKQYRGYVSLIPIIAFWFLDSYYLQLERKLRILFERVSKSDDNNDNEYLFHISILSSNKEHKTLFLQVLLSKTELGFYIPIALSVVLLVCLA
jgi:hypothetical protein